MRYFILCLLAGILLLSCEKENFGSEDIIIGTGNGFEKDEVEGDLPVEEEIKKEFIDTTDWSGYDESEYLIGFGGACETVETVRATITMGDNETAAQTLWESGDRVKVYVPAKEQVGIYAYDATRKQFRPIDLNNVVSTKGNVAYAYYPADAYGESSGGTMALTLENGVALAADLGDKLPMSAKILSTQADPHPVAAFKNLCSILRVQLTGCEKATAVTLSNDNIPLVGAASVTWNGENPSLTTSGGAKSITFDLGEGVTLNESTPIEYFFILPSNGTKMSGMKVTTTFAQTLNSTTYTPSFTRSRNSALEVGRSKVIKVALRMGYFSGGDGTEANPYQVATAKDLLQMSNLIRSTSASDGYNGTNNYFSDQIYYKQTADIDASSLGTTMNPIGDKDRKFTGVYDGQTKTISNLKIVDKNEIQVALFASLNAGTLQNITLQNATISSISTDKDSNTAALVGRIGLAGVVSNCHVITSTVSGLKCGGIVGYCNEGTISNCYSRGNTVAASGTYKHEDGEEDVTGFCGGVLGGSHNVILEDCCCFGSAASGTGTPSTITGEGATGGIAGYIGGDAGSGEVNRCYVSNTNITSTGNYVGGQVGRFYNGSLLGRPTDDGTLNSVDFRKGDVSIQGKTQVGGLIGYNSGSVTGTKYNTTSYTALVFKVTVTATGEKAGGLCGVNDGILTTAYCNNSTITCQAGGYCGGVVGHLLYTSSSRPGKLIDCLYRYSTITATNGNGTYYSYVGGYCGYMENKTTIDNSTTTSFSGYGSTIEGQEQVGAVAGRMAGGTIIGRPENHLISGGASESGLELPLNVISKTNSCSYGVGRYETTEDGVKGKISGLIVGHSTIARNQMYGSFYLGGIVGYAKNELDITSCQCNGIVFNAQGQIGGIAGRFTGNGQISNCTNNLMQTSAYNVANNGILEHVGGICGVFETGEMYRCNNFSSISGGLYVGGIAGTMWGGDMYQCYSGKNITISGKHDVGGLAGKLGASNEDHHHDCLVLCCTARSNVTGTGVYDTENFRGSVGGLVGEMATSGAYQTSLAHCVAWETTVQNTYSKAKNIGAIVGYVNAKEVNKTMAAKNIIQGCYSQHASSNLKVAGAQAAYNTNNAGGVYGYLRCGTVKDCFYCCDQVGIYNTNSTITNRMKITPDQINGIATIASVPLTTGAEQKNKYLYEVLNAMKDKVSYPITRSGNKSLVGWTTYTSGSYKFAVPTVLTNTPLGTKFYLD